MVAVSNSTALMHLSAMGHLDLLRTLFTEIHIPDAVYEEVVGRGTGKPGAAEVAAADWIKRHTVGNALAVMMLCGDLQAGEAECLVLAAELGADLLILDDGAARLEAVARGDARCRHRRHPSEGRRARSDPVSRRVGCSSCYRLPAEGFGVRARVSLVEGGLALELLTFCAFEAGSSDCEKHHRVAAGAHAHGAAEAG